jgi:peptidoglycan hydrolase CwlO-like protein
LITPLIAAGAVIVLLAAWLVLTNGNLDDTESTLASARSRITKLDKKVSSLSSEIESLEDEKSDLETQNSSLNSAMVDCKDAASKTRKVFSVAFKQVLGTASAYDVRTALQDADRAWSVCRAAASSNGAI